MQTAKMQRKCKNMNAFYFGMQRRQWRYNRRQVLHLKLDNACADLSQGKLFVWMCGYALFNVHI